MLEKFPHASEELAWRFHRADALTGTRGQSIDPTPHAAFDSKAAERMHDARIRDSHREAVEKRDRIDAMMRRMTSDQRHVIDLSFNPFGRASQGLAAYFTVSSRPFGGTAIQLVRLAMEVPETVEAYRMHAGRSPDNGWELLAWLEKEAPIARNEGDVFMLRTRKPTSHPFARILASASALVVSVVGEYDRLRVERYQAGRRRQEDLLKRELENAHARMWGAPLGALP